MSCVASAHLLKGVLRSVRAMVEKQVERPGHTAHPIARETAGRRPRDIHTNGDRDSHPSRLREGLSWPAWPSLQVDRRANARWICLFLSVCPALRRQRQPAAIQPAQPLTGPGLPPSLIGDARTAERGASRRQLVGPQPVSQIPADDGRCNLDSPLPTPSRSFLICVTHMGVCRVAAGVPARQIARYTGRSGETRFVLLET